MDKYEQDLAAIFNVRKALAQSSGSASLHTALRCLGVKRDDEVLIPAIAPIPTILPILTSQARPVVVDIEKDSLGFDAEDLLQKISPRTKAAIVVPLWGYPIDYTRTMEVLGKFDIPLIEDAAQAHGSKLGSRYVGTFGTVGCFSTHDRKLISTGEGGFILTNDPQLYDRMKQFSQLGYMDGQTYGVNYKLTALQAALGSFRIRQLEEQIQKRTNNAVEIIDMIKHTSLMPLQVPTNGRANYYSLVLRLPWDEKRNLEYVKRLDELGIPSDIIKYGFSPIYRRQMFAALYSECPNAEVFTSSMTTIPVHPGLTKDEVVYIGSAIVTTYKEFADDYSKQGISLKRDNMDEQKQDKIEKHYTSSVLVVTESEPKRILLVYHKKLNKWMPPGGHQESFENPYETAIREIKEETSIDISKYIPRPESVDDRAISLPIPLRIFEERIDAAGDKPEHFHIDMIYLVTVPYQVAVVQEAEASSIGWFTKQDIDKLPLFENVAELIKRSALS